MALMQKLSAMFNRSTQSVGKLIMSLSIGFGGMIAAPHAIDTTLSTEAPVTEPLQRAAALAKAEGMAAEIARWQKSIRNDMRVIETAEENIGKGNAPLAQQFEDIKAARARLEAQRAEQRQRLLDMRQELVFNPALSEAQASAIHSQLDLYGGWSYGMHDAPAGFGGFPGFGQRIQLRDEAIASLGLAANPSAHSFKAADDLMVEVVRLDQRNNWHETIGSLGAGAVGTLGSLLVFGAVARKREDESGNETAAAPVPLATDNTIGVANVPLLTPSANQKLRI